MKRRDPSLWFCKFKAQVSSLRPHATYIYPMSSMSSSIMSLGQLRTPYLPYLYTSSISEEKLPFSYQYLFPIVQFLLQYYSCHQSINPMQHFHFLKGQSSTDVLFLCFLLMYYTLTFEKSTTFFLCKSLKIRI